MAVLASLIAAGASPPAAACGTFRARAAAATPSPERERVLVVFDPVARVEHLVREVTFRAGAEPFAFVIPVPARPELAEVATSPFERLALEHPLAADRAEAALGAASAGAGSIVVEQKQVAGFDAAVLDAHDPALVTEWLDARGFVVGAAGAAWVARYGRPGFHMVALRYAAPTQPGTVVSRVLRLTFAASLPFFPYREPDDAPDRAARELDVWLVSPWAHAAISTWTPETKSGAPRELGRPWAERARRREADVSWLAGVIGAAVPPRAVVTAFVDHNTTRESWGDVVLVPAAGASCDPACRQGSRTLAALADPTLGEEGATPPSGATDAHGTYPEGGRPPAPVSSVAPPALDPDAPPAASWWPVEDGARRGAHAALLTLVAATLTALVAWRERRRDAWALAAALVGVALALAWRSRRLEQQRALRDAALAASRAEQRALHQRRRSEELRKVDALTGGPLSRLTAPQALDTDDLALDSPPPTLPDDVAARRARWGELLAGALPVGGVPEVAPDAAPSEPDLGWMAALLRDCGHGQGRAGALDLVIETSAPPRVAWLSGPFTRDFSRCAARFLDAALHGQQLADQATFSLRLGGGHHAWPVAPSLTGVSWSVVADSSDGAPASLALRRTLRGRLRWTDGCRPEAASTKTPWATIAVALDARTPPRVVAASTGPDDAWRRAAACVQRLVTVAPWPGARSGHLDLRVTLAALPPRPPPPAGCRPGDPLCGL